MRVAKVFISSTFRDMQAERDHLVRVVFPRLRSDLARDGVHLVDVDLRWGVTSEDNVRAACSEIIEDCLPHFVGILGGRYGWVPGGEELSITHEEIRCVLRRPEAGRPHALFYVRDPEALAGVPDATRASYEEPPQSEPARRLSRLFSELQEAGHEIRRYRCRWSGTAGRLVDLQSFGELVHADLLCSIRTQVLGTGEAPAPAVGEFEAFRLANEAFIESRLVRYFAGERAALLERLAAFCLGSGTERELTVVGPPGSGKSALLARLVREHLRPAPAPRHGDEVKIVPVFIGGGDAGSTDVRRILRQLVWELGDPGDPVPMSHDEVQKRFLDLMSDDAAFEGRRVVLLLDAVDQLGRAHDGHNLAWLPSGLPSQVRVLISAAPGVALEALRGRLRPASEVVLEPLSPSDQAALSEQWLWSHRKKLEAAQRAAILAKAHAGRPLYLVASLEELRTLGTFEEITQRIEELPARTDELFDWILARLENDPIFRATGSADRRDIVAPFFRFIATSRQGMAMSELVELVSPEDPGGEIATLERLVRPYLMLRGTLITFYHSAFREAVKRRYLASPGDVAATHRILAAYFRSKIDSPGPPEKAPENARPLQELVFHLIELGDLPALRALHADLGFLEAFCRDVEAGVPDDVASGHGGADVLSANLQRLLEMIEDRKEAVDSGAAGEWVRLAGFLARCAGVLRRVPEALAQEIRNHQSVGSADLPEALVSAAARRPARSLASSAVLRSAPAAGGQQTRITAIAVAGSVRRFMSGAADGRVGVWEAGGARPLWIASAHQSFVTAAALSADGRRALSGGDDGSLYLWDADLGQRQSLHGLWGRSRRVWPPIEACAFAGDETAWVYSQGELRILDLARRCVIRAVRVPDAERLRTMFEGAGFAAAAERAAVVRGKGDEVAIVGCRDGSLLRSLALPGRADRLLLSHDGAILLVSDRQGRMTVVELDEGFREHRHHAVPLSAVCAVDRDMLAADRRRGLTRFDPVRGAVIAQVPLSTPADFVTALDASAGAGILVAGRNSGAHSIHAVADLAPVQELPAAASFRLGAILDLGRRVVAVRGTRSSSVSLRTNEAVLLDDTGGAGELPFVHPRPVTCAASLGETRAITVDEGGSVVAWEGASRRPVDDVPKLGFTACSEWRPGGVGVLGTTDERVVVLRSRPKVIPFPSNRLEFRAGISAIAATGWPLILFATYFNGIVRYRSRRRQWTGLMHPRIKFRGTAAALERRGRLAASGTLDGRVQIWSGEDGTMRRDLGLHDGQVTALEFSPSGRCVVSGGIDGALFLIDARELRVLDGTTFAVPIIGLRIPDDGAVRVFLGNGNVARCAAPAVPE